VSDPRAGCARLLECVRPSRERNRLRVEFQRRVNRYRCVGELAGGFEITGEEIQSFSPLLRGERRRPPLFAGLSLRAVSVFVV